VRQNVAVQTPGREGPGHPKAFVMGGAGCLVGFFVLGLFALAVGGTFYFDGGGLVMLFVIGGLLGIFANWFYRRGRKAGPPGPPWPPQPPQGPPF
jgi:hypothetical protein